MSGTSLTGRLRREEPIDGKIPELTFVLSDDEEVTLFGCDITTIDWFRSKDGGIAIQLSGKAVALVKGPKRSKPQPGQGFADQIMKAKYEIGGDME